MLTNYYGDRKSPVGRGASSVVDEVLVSTGVDGISRKERERERGIERESKAPICTHSLNYYSMHSVTPTVYCALYLIIWQVSKRAREFELHALYYGQF